ncbi:hypothetical protein BD413DRAFT_610417 [Trametes elegans]|nr:hypothetical protein BD413DRAFT_610417 [Trametes elegans]
MAFAVTCRNIRIENGELKASARTVEQTFRESALDLVPLIVNDDGAFAIPGDAFIVNARDVRYDDPMDDGYFSHAQVSVCQRVVTRNGALQLADGNDVDRLGSDAADFFNGTNCIGSAIAGVLYAGKEGWGYPAMTYLTDSPVFSTGLIVVGLLKGSTGNATAAALLDPL